MTPGLSSLSDTRLIALFREGAQEAFEEIVRRYEGRVWSLVRGMTRNDADAEDAVQDAFLAIVKHIGRFRGASSLSTWIYRIAMNAALMKLRRRRHDDRTVAIDESLPGFDGTGHRVAALPDWHPAVDQVLLNKELGEKLRGWIGELPIEYRTVFLLRDQEGLGNEEVAAVTRLSVAAVKSRLHRARIHLRERAKAYVHGGA